MLWHLLIRLYSRLIKLFPARFLDEFGGEMCDLFSHVLSDLEDSGISPIKRRLKMSHLFFREVWDFSGAYLEARRYQVSLNSSETSSGKTEFGGGQPVETWKGSREPWTTALIGALPFLLFGSAYLLEGIAELSGHFPLGFNLLNGRLLEGPPERPAMILTLPIGAYFVSVIGLLIGTWKGFPRWSYAFLGMSIYFGWYYSNGRYFGVVYGWWAWLPVFAAFTLGLLLNRSLQPLAQFLQNSWSDWTRLSFTFYAFALPMTTIIFFDDNWGISQLHGLIFDTVILAVGAVVFLRSHNLLGRALSIVAVVLILGLSGVLRGWFDSDYWLVGLYFLMYVGFLMLPALIGLLRRGLGTWLLR